MNYLKMILLVGTIMLSAATASMGNTAPVSDAGEDQPVTVGSQVKLDGGASYDVDKDKLTYIWSFTSQPVGTTAELSKPTGKKTKFTADVAGLYELELVVNDGIKDDTNSVIIEATLASIENTPPVADAGEDQIFASSVTVTLDGSGSSDADGDKLTYSWSFTSQPVGTTAELSKPTGKKTKFTADIIGSYVIQLIVNDGSDNSLSDSVRVKIGNTPPVSNAGTDQNIHTASTVTLNGSASSDADDDSLTYNWSIISTPDGSTAILIDPTDVDPTFIADVDGSYVMQLIVNDGTVDSSADSVTVVATPLSTLKKTGQTKTYVPYDDGYYKIGVNPSYIRDDTNEIVKDNVTGLEWQDDAGAKTVEESWWGADRYCAALTLGGGDWRLPTVVELQGIVVDAAVDPSIDITVFQNLSSDIVYWSSTTYTNITDYAWFVDFKYGYADYYPKGVNISVRCVRTGQ